MLQWSVSTSRWFLMLGLHGASWTAASVIVLGDAVVESVVSSAFPRRDGVIVVGTDLDDADVWRRAVNIRSRPRRVPS